jgi:Arc/MetJ-type ribon-helix-helix transcriptional regulator
MTINVSKDVEDSINAAVQKGLFASAEEMIAQLVREHAQRTPPSPAEGAAADADPLVGIWRDYTDEMDDLVADAMKRRKEEPWRVIPGE